MIYNAEVSIPALILAYATGYVATRRSLPWGGAGLVEVMMTFALVWVGVPLAPALLGVVTYRAVQLLAAGDPGAGRAAGGAPDAPRLPPRREGVRPQLSDRPEGARCCFPHRAFWFAWRAAGALCRHL